MSLQTLPLQSLVEKIQSLSADRIAEVEDFVDFLRQQPPVRRTPSRQPPDFPVISVGTWQEEWSLRREELYGDDGR
jgi:hypothetical protein